MQKWNTAIAKFLIKTVSLGNCFIHFRKEMSLYALSRKTFSDILMTVSEEKRM